MLFGRKKKENKIVVKNGKDQKGREDIRVYPDLLRMNGLKKDSDRADDRQKGPRGL